jgi:hypothetical protein
MEEQTVVKIRNKLDPNLSMASLKEAYESVKALNGNGDRTKLLAELSYLISSEHLRSGEFDEAATSARESIRLYESLDVKTLEDAAPILFRHVPDKMHEGVVRERVLAKIPERFLSQT